MRKKPNDDFVGLLALVRDSGEDHPLVEDFPNVLKLLANQFYTAERWHTFQTLLTTERQQSASEHFKAILTRAKADFAHGAFAKLQRVGLQVHNARRELRRGNQPTVTSALDTIDGLKEEITRLIKDVLSAEIAPASNSSRQAGRPASSAEWVRVPDSIDMFANSLGGLATVAKKTIIPRVDPPSTFPINKMDFDEILSNLIHNAIKYSVEFSKIKISLHHTTRRTMLDITSYGIEISPQDREQIFERGYRTDLAAMIAFNALGIGLSQARRLAENAGASLFVLASEELGKDSLTPTIRIHGKEYPAFRNTFRLTSHR